MSLIDIIGPVMVGPSSSHTAGAVRIGNLTRKLWGWDKPLHSVKIFLRGSFAATYWGHGTDRGLVAGLLRMNPDDMRIPEAFKVAENENLFYEFESEEVDGAHPNSVRLVMTDEKSKMEVVGASTGGGMVELHGLDGFSMKVPYGPPTLISMHRDVPGVIAVITAELYRNGLNLASMDLSRNVRGGLAIGVFILDGKASPDLPERVQSVMPACERVILLTGDANGGK